MKLRLEDLGKIYTFEYFDGSIFIKMKGKFSFDDVDMRCVLDDIELLSHKNVIRDDYYTCLNYDNDKMRNFEDLI